MTKDRPVSARLFSTWQLWFAAFLGTPVAAGVLAAHTLRGLGREAHATKAVWMSVAATAAGLALAYVLPEDLPSAALPAGLAGGVYFLAKTTLERDVSAALESGATKGSWWVVAGVSLLVAIIVLAIAGGINIAVEPAGAGSRVV